MTSHKSNIHFNEQSEKPLSFSFRFSSSSFFSHCHPSIAPSRRSEDELENKFSMLLHSGNKNMVDMAMGACPGNFMKVGI